MSERELTDDVGDRPARGRGWLLIVGIIIGLGIAVGGTLVLVAGQRARAELAYQSCREANLPGAYIRLVLERNPRFDARELGIPDPDEALPILACRRTVAGGQPVRLGRREEARYLEVLARGRLPVVDDGGDVVGSERLPAPPRGR